MHSEEDLFQNIEHYDERFVLHPSGTMYWKRNRWLIISDIHLGKSHHFRKKGMAVPSNIDKGDIEMIGQLIDQFNPRKVILLGDLFHSDYNSSWEQFADFTRKYKSGFFVLVRGNHDVLNDWHYGRTTMEVVQEIRTRNLLFTHIPLKDPNGWVNICGHIHSGIVLHGKGRQRVRVRAFFFRHEHIYMPAFGSFTGAVHVKPEEDDVIVGIAEGELVVIQG